MSIKNHNAPCIKLKVKLVVDGILRAKSLCAWINDDDDDAEEDDDGDDDGCGREGPTWADKDCFENSRILLNVKSSWAWVAWWWWQIQMRDWEVMGSTVRPSHYHVMSNNPGQVVHRRVPLCSVVLAKGQWFKTFLLALLLRLLNPDIELPFSDLSTGLRSMNALDTTSQPSYLNNLISGQSFRQPRQSCLDSLPHSPVSSSLLSSPLSSSFSLSLQAQNLPFQQIFPP